MPQSLKDADSPLRLLQPVDADLVLVHGGAWHTSAAQVPLLIRSYRPQEGDSLESHQQLLHHVAMHIREAEVAALKLVGQPGVVDPQAV